MAELMLAQPEKCTVEELEMAVGIYALSGCDEEWRIDLAIAEIKSRKGIPDDPGEMN